MSSFHERQKSLFEHLKNAEDQCSFSKTNKVSSRQDYGTIDKQVYRKLKQEMKQFRGRESIFKRSDANIRECLRARTIPDYIKNPQKWVYYSLADVTPEQMSDKTNTETALTFLREMERRNAENTNNDDEEIDETGAIFKKPKFQVSKIISNMSTEKQQSVLKDNKVIMPEYVVGVTNKKANNRLVKNKQIPKTDVESNSVELKLGHLYEEDTDDIM